MTNELAPVSLHNIPTLANRKPDGLVIIAFCPICDRTAEAPDDGGSREHVAAAAIAKIQIHIRQAHPSKRRRSKPSPPPDRQVGPRQRPVEPFDAI